MMIRLILVLSLILTASAFAEDSSSGCGLGWQVARKDSLLSSAVRSTTHVILPNTFSMTSGTSGCAQHSLVKNESEQMYFVEANLEQLALEGARGDGEYLRNFAAVMGCSGSVGEFSSTVQKSYSEIFGTEATPARVLEGVRREIRANPSLAFACGATS